MKDKILKWNDVLNFANNGNPAPDRRVEKKDEEFKRKKIIKNFFKKRAMKKISFTPYVRTEIEIRNIMKDVIISLFPAIIAAGLVYGLKAFLVIATSVFSALITGKLFSRIFNRF